MTETSPQKKESFRTRLLRWGFNLFPAYFATGARITFVAEDISEVRIELPLTWRTRNYVGTIFGGSIYGAVDPVYMIMLIKRLGAGYAVWDKAASVRFKKAGRSTLYARFVVDDGELRAVRKELDVSRSTDRHYRVDLTDGRGVVHATVEKTVYVRRKDPAPSDRVLAASRGLAPPGAAPTSRGDPR